MGSRRAVVRGRRIRRRRHDTISFARDECVGTCALWSTELGETDEGHGPPRVSPDRRVYVKVGSRLLSLSDTGRLLWSFNTWELLRDHGISLVSAGEVSIAPDGTVFTDYHAALDAQRSVLWTYRPQMIVGCDRPVTIEDGRTLIYEPEIGPLPAKLTALGHDGGVSWSIESGPLNCGFLPLPVASPSEPGRFAYVTCGEDCRTSRELIVASNATGRSERILPLRADRPLRLQVVLPDGRIVASGRDDGMAQDLIFLLDPHRDSNSDPVVGSAPIPSSPREVLAGDDGQIYVIHLDGVVALDGRLQLVWSWRPTHSAFTAAGTILPTGCLAVPVSTFQRVQVENRVRNTDWRSGIVCLHTTARELAPSPWPRTTGGHHGARRPRGP